jgi:tyrosine-protein kinase Etk/Wzc
MKQSQNTDEYSNQADGSKSRFDWMEILSLLWQSRKFIGIVIGAVTVLAVVISLILPESFKSTAVLLPDTDKSKLASAGGSLSSLAAIAGVNINGEVSIVRLYPTILKSESVLKTVIYSKYQTKKYSDSVNLIQYWDIKEKNPERDYEVALLNLQTRMDVALDLKTAVLTMSIETEEPQLSADILNITISVADRFIRTQRNTSASEQRKWIEARLVEVKADLSKAENVLKEFREKNRMVSGSPQLLLDQERLLREVQINSTMYVELKRQYELAKIEEIRTTPIINVLDYGRAAAKKERPKRAIIVLVSMMLAFVVSGSYRVIEQAYGRTITEWYKRLRSLNRL